MEINLKNIEEIIFFNEEIHKILPEFSVQFGQWKIGKRVPPLADLGRNSVIEVLNLLDQNHIEILENYFETDIIIDKLSSNIIKNHSIELDENLCGFYEYKSFCVFRGKENIELTFWR